MWGQSYQFPCQLPQPNIQRPKKKKKLKKKKSLLTDQYGEDDWKKFLI